MARLTLKRSLREASCCERGSNEGRHRIAPLFARPDGAHDVLGALDLVDDRLRASLVGDLDGILTAADEARGQRGRLLRSQAGVDGPVFALLEGADFAFALHDHAHGHGLDTAGRKAAPHLVPQQR